VTFTAGAPHKEMAGPQTLPFPYPPVAFVWTMQTANLLSQDTGNLAQNIPDTSAKGWR
jgi:hypothetical protein